MFVRIAAIVSLFLLVAIHLVEAQDRYAVVVGVEKYDTGTFNNLEFANEDASSIGKSLSNLKYKVVLMSAESESTRFHPTTPSKIKKVLQTQIKACAKNDTLIISLSGHGVQFADEPIRSDGSRETYFCPGDADLTDKSTLLPISEVFDMVQKCAASRKLILLDCCRNEQLSPDSKTKSSLKIKLDSVHESKRTFPDGMTLLFSCQNKQFSWEHKPLNQSVFSHFVAQYLEGHASSEFYEKRSLNINGLISYVSKNTNSYVLEKGLSADGQNPVFLGSSSNWSIGQLSAVEYWPQFRGVNRDGKSLDRDLELDLTTRAPVMAWKADGLGQGHGSVTISNGRAFVIGSIDNKHYVTAVDPKNGDRLWQKLFDERPIDADLRDSPKAKIKYRGTFRGSAANSTPTLIDGKLYVISPFGRVVCMDQTDGRIIWSHELVEYKTDVLWGGFCNSLLVENGKVICTMPGHDPIMVALDPATGKESWKCSIDGVENSKSNYPKSSPKVMNHQNNKFYVANTPNGLVGVDRWGKLQWHVEVKFNQYDSEMLIHNSYIFIRHAYSRGIEAFRVVPDNEDRFKLKTEQVYEHTGQGYTSGPIALAVALDGIGYFADRQGRISAVDIESGRRLWMTEERGPGKGSSTVVAAGNQLVFRFSDSTVAIANVSRDGLEWVGSFKLQSDDDYEEFLNLSPAVVTGEKLYVRLFDELRCYSLVN